MSSMLRKFKRNKDNKNYTLTNEELQELTKRMYELKDEAIICCNTRDFNRLNEIGKELSDIKKKLKLAEKNSKKIKNF